jgi:hypothetical protein
MDRIIVLCVMAILPMGVMVIMSSIYGRWNRNSETGKNRRHWMKKAVELLKVIVVGIYAADITSESKAESVLENIRLSIREVLELLESPPRWETPEQWEKRTGEKWPDKGPVWERFIWWPEPPVYSWNLKEHWLAKPEERIVVCATEAEPPPDEWRPEKP